MKVLKEAMKNEFMEAVNKAADFITEIRLRLGGEANSDFRQKLIREILQESKNLKEGGSPDYLKIEKIPVCVIAKTLSEIPDLKAVNFNSDVDKPLAGPLNLSANWVRTLRNRFVYSARKRKPAPPKSVLEPATEVKEPEKKQVIEVQEGLEGLAIEIRTPTGLSLSLQISFSK